MKTSLRAGVLAIGVVGFLLAGCFSHSDNIQLTEFNPEIGHRPDIKAVTEDDKLVVVTFSGGGIRAASLAFGALQGLDGLSKQPDGSSLIDRIDYVSSVSGGSVTAGWFAMNGASGLRGPAGDAYQKNFLERSHTWPIAARGLNPVALGGYLFTDYKRIDVLADYFASGPIGKATMAEVTKRYSERKSPFVILNAADMTYGYGFSFTQNNFDLLCSDLSSFRLADAVAASAAFPFAFSPITLRNYSGPGCAWQQQEGWKKHGQPAWINGMLEYYDVAMLGSQARSPAPNDIPFLREARIRNTFLRGENKYVHLLDGGLVDNLGIKPLIMMDDIPSEEPGLRNRYRPEQIRAPFDKVREILFVVVNARSDNPSDNNQREYPPGLFDTFSSVVGSPLDSSILNIQHQLTAELGSVTGKEPAFVAGMADAAAPRPPGAPPPVTGAKAYIATVDFDLIPDQIAAGRNDGGDCRRDFKRLATSWSLEPKQIAALIGVSRALLSRSPGLAKFLEDTKMAPALVSQDFTAVCADVKG
jgi:NTE family protein